MRIGGRSQNLGFSFGSGHTMAASSGGDRSSPGPMGSRGFCCGWLKNASMPAIAGSISSPSAVSSGGGLTEAMMDLVVSMSSWSLEFSFCSAASCAMRSLSPPVSIPARSATGSASSTAGLASSPPFARTTSLDARDLESPPKLATTLATRRRRMICCRSGSSRPRRRARERREERGSTRGQIAARGGGRSRRFSRAHRRARAHRARSWTDIPAPEPSPVRVLHRLARPGTFLFQRAGETSWEPPVPPRAVGGRSVAVFSLSGSRGLAQTPSRGR